MVLTAQRRPADTTLRSSMQGSLFEAAPLGFAPVTSPPEPLDERSSVLFQPGWLQGSGPIFDQLRDDMPWCAMERPMYDRVVDVPRLICTIDPVELARDHPLRITTNALQNVLHSEFHAIGLNYYRDGSDSVAWHRDTLRRTGRPLTVALVSLGSPRTLAVRPHASHPSKTAETTRTTAATRRRWRLGHGDLFVMTGASQREWEHCVPKEKSVGPRISLAFRCLEAPGGPRIGRAGVPPLLASHKLQ